MNTRTGKKQSPVKTKTNPAPKVAGIKVKPAIKKKADKMAEAILHKLKVAQDKKKAAQDKRDAKKAVKAPVATPAPKAPAPPVTPAPVLPPAPPVTPAAAAPKVKRYESKTDPDSKYHQRERSTATKPVGIVRAICVANPGKARKDIIALCVAQGVNKNTAATQFSLWKSANNPVTK